jgi:hypothetical protein
MVNKGIERLVPDFRFVKEGMVVEVRMTSFPKSELGSVEGKVVWVGSDVLPPAPGRPYYATLCNACKDSVKSPLFRREW